MAFLRNSRGTGIALETHVFVEKENKICSTILSKTAHHMLFGQMAVQLGFPYEVSVPKRCSESQVGVLYSFCFRWSVCPLPVDRDYVLGKTTGEIYLGTVARPNCCEVCGVSGLAHGSENNGRCAASSLRPREKCCIDRVPLPVL